MRELDSAEAFEFYRKLLEFLGSRLHPDSYLEIGLADADTFQRMMPYCRRLRGVDPVLPPLGDLGVHCELFPLTSDEYFQRHAEETYDLVFIDGLHEHRQVLRDIHNALARLRPHGMILAHDTFPSSPEMTNPRACGDAYKAVIELRQDRSLEVFTIPVRYGVTLIGKIGTEFPWV